MKRFTSLLLALLMALTLLPAAAWAEETAPADTQPEETPVVTQRADGGAVVYMVDAADDADTGIATYADGEDLAERAKAAGFVAMEMGEPDDYETPSIFRMSSPVGLEENTDYTYTYDYENGHLTLNLLPGVASHWKAALLNCVTSDELVDTLKFDFRFNRTEDTVSGALCTPQRAAERLEGFLNGEYYKIIDFRDKSTGSAGFGDDFAMATPVSNDSNTEIRVEAGVQDYLYLVVWQNEAGDCTEYFLKVTVDGGEGFRHTVATPKLRDLAAERITFNSDDINDISDSWDITTALGQLSLTPKEGNALNELATYIHRNYYDIGTFAVTAPGDEYTLQSYYIIDQVKGDRHYNDLPASDPDSREYFMNHLELFTSDNENGGTVRFTLRWANVNSEMPDIVEKLNLRVSPRPWGKLTATEGDPNILDVACLYNYILLEQKPITEVDKVDPQLAAYDLNYDGHVDVYDIQTLYECVALGTTSAN